MMSLDQEALGSVPCHLPSPRLPLSPLAIQLTLDSALLAACGVVGVIGELRVVAGWRGAFILSGYSSYRRS